MKRLLLTLAFVGPLLWGTGVARAATVDYGPPPAPVFVTCQTLSVDPPSTASYVNDTFTGTIKGVAFSRTVGYGVTTPHLAVVDISDLTTAIGPLHIHGVTTWNIGTGSTPFDATLTCHEAPTTTTTVAPTTTTSTAAATTTTTKRLTAPPITAFIATPLNSLPRTGGNSNTPLYLGGGALAAGALALVGSRKRSR